MFARVTTFQIAPDQVDEGIRTVEAKIRPSASGQPGFLDLDIAVDRQTGRGYVVTWWADEASIAASEANAHQLRAQTSQTISSETLSARTYECTYQASENAPRAHAARVTPFRVSADRVDEVTQWTNEQLMPTYRAQSGFANWLNLTDRTTGEGYVVSLWERAEAMQAAEALVGQSRVRGTEEMGLQLGPTERYEVVG
jgi:heme-degrading monooxygenase HmoA